MADRVLVYSHDTYGLGHLRRCLLLMDGLAAAPEIGPMLLLTGSPRAEVFDLPPGADRVALPALTKDRRGGYRPRGLEVPLAELLRLRSQLILAAAVEFRPDVVLVDHAPAGALGELWPALEALSAATPRPRLVLGLRDVIDDAERVRAEWDRLSAWIAIDDLYDRILVYGDPDLTTTAQELGLPFRRPGAVVHTGYLARRGRARRRPRRDRPTIVVAVGGGGDGQQVLRAYADFLDRVPAPALFDSVVVTGPFLSRRRRTEIRARLAASGHPVEVIEFTDRFEDLLARAGGVVSMAGYNTVTEILAAGVPALLVPRERPRLEQVLRARRLAPVAGMSWCPSGSLDPRRLARFVAQVVAGEARRPRGVRLDGADRTVQEVRALLAEPRTDIPEPAEEVRPVGASVAS